MTKSPMITCNTAYHLGYWKEKHNSAAEGKKNTHRECFYTLKHLYTYATGSVIVVVLCSIVVHIVVDYS